MKIPLLGFLLGSFIVFTTILPAQVASGARTWVDQSGRTVRGQLLEVQGVSVVLRLENNTLVNVPLARFSAPDVEYVKQWAKSTGKPDPTLAALPLTWPESVVVDPKSLQITNGEQSAAARRFVYQSGSFLFTSNAPLTGSLMREIAGDFELVKTLFTKLPWGWQSKPEGGGSHFLAMLHETDQDYTEAGGSDNSSGWSKDGLIFTKFSTLGLKKVGERYARDSKLKREGEMIGLITRLVMGDMRDLALPWSALGLEQFLEEVAYRNGSFQFLKLERSLKDLVASKGTQGILPDVNEMIKLLHKSWTEDRGDDVLEIRRKNYFYGAMLIYYFGFLDGEGKGARLHRYFQAMAKDAMAWRAYSEARKAGDRSVTNPRPNTTFADWAMDLNKSIIEGRTDDQLRADMLLKFKSIGIKL